MESPAVPWEILNYPSHQGHLLPQKRPCIKGLWVVKNLLDTVRVWRELVAHIV